MRSEKNRHYELGKYMAAIQGSLPGDIRKKTMYQSSHQWFIDH